MPNPKNVIALNGKIYDVTTGTIVSSLKSPKATETEKAKAEKSKPAAKKQTIDGIVASKPVTRLRPVGKIKPKQHKKASHISRHKPQKAKTLIRSSVKPQEHETKSQEASSSVTHPIDKARQQRSSAISRSGLIKRFNNSSEEVTKKLAPLKVKKPKLQKLAAAASTNASHSTATDNIFTRAIEQATSHKQPAVKLKKHTVSKRLRKASKRSKVMLGTLAVVIVVGLGVWRYLPNIQMRIASVRAGFNASLPSYKPSGFSHQTISYKQGQVTLSYKSNSDSRNFSIQQSASHWDSETLLESYIKPTVHETPISYQNNGKTIYIYNGSDATWVSGGVWYKIEGQSNLNSDQLLRIANSL